MGSWGCPPGDLHRKRSYRPKKSMFKLYVKMLGIKGVDPIKRILLEPDLITMEVYGAKMDIKKADSQDSPAGGLAVGGSYVIQNGRGDRI